MIILNNNHIDTTYTYYTRDYDYFKEVDSLSLSNTYLNFRKSVNNHISNPNHFNNPKYKKKRYKQSYTTSYINDNIRIDTKYNTKYDIKYNLKYNTTIRIPKIGYISIRYHRSIPYYYKIKNITITKNSIDKYYISINVEYIDNIDNSIYNNTCNIDNQYNTCNTIYNTYNHIKPIININNSIGIDYNVSNLLVSTDIYLNNVLYSTYNRFYNKKEEYRISYYNRLLSKCKRYSNRYNKIRKRISKIYNKIKNRRYDYLHKLSSIICDQYDIICIEDISIEDIGNKHSKYKLGKYTYDNGWYMFTNMINYKQYIRDNILIVIDKYYPSTQLCHICGYKNMSLKNNLNIREWICNNCHTIHNRDINSAYNIRNEGIRIIKNIYKLDNNNSNNNKNSNKKHSIVLQEIVEQEIRDKIHIVDIVDNKNKEDKSKEKNKEKKHIVLQEIAYIDKDHNKDNNNKI